MIRAKLLFKQSRGQHRIQAVMEAMSAMEEASIEVSGIQFYGVEFICDVHTDSFGDPVDHAQAHDWVLAKLSACEILHVIVIASDTHFRPFTQEEKRDIKIMAKEDERKAI